jgi:hypothetical protein
VVGGRVLTPSNVQIRVELANGAWMTVKAHDAMWLVIVQRRGDHEGTAIRSVELLGEDDSLIERKVLEPPEAGRCKDARHERRLRHRPVRKDR